MKHVPDNSDDKGMIGPGRKLGRYRLGEPLGRGGMSAVYRAYDPALDRQVAIKILQAELARDETYRKRFREEARALGRVNHPNLVPIYAVGQEGSVSYYAMALVEGPTLAQVLKARGALSIEQSLAVFGQFLSGLRAVHAANIVHRDIKPGNVMIDRSGRVLLMDFGLARRADRETLTAAGSVLGTPEYMSPEQTQGGAIDARSDLYSAGVILFEMLSGRPPFAGKDTIGILRQHAETPPPDLGALRRDAPPELVGVAHRLLEKKPESRYADVAEVTEALAPLAPTGGKSEQTVRELVASMPKAAAPTAALNVVAASWEVATPAQAADGASASRILYRRERLRTRIAIGAAVIAVLALIVAVINLFRGPGRPDDMPPPRPPGTSASAGQSWWRVTLRGGERFEGRWSGSRQAPDGRTIYVFEDRDGNPVEIPASDARRWERGGDTQ